MRRREKSCWTDGQMLPTPSWLRFRKSSQQQQQQGARGKLAKESPVVPPRSEPNQASKSKASPSPALSLAAPELARGASNPQVPSPHCPGASSGSHRRLPFTRKTLVGLIQRALSPISSASGAGAGRSGARNRTHNNDNDPGLAASESPLEAQRETATAAAAPGSSCFGRAQQSGSDNNEVSTHYSIKNSSTASLSAGCG